MARYFPLAEVWASDIRDEEFTKNPRINWNKGDLFEGLRGHFDLIICNFPYVPSWLCEGLEPRIAFDGGHDGFDLIGRFLSGVDKFVPRSNFLIAIEMYHLHGEQLGESWQVVKDSQQFDRFAFRKG
jgi:Methylase of polypeptide chain release factors